MTAARQCGHVPIARRHLRQTDIRHVCLPLPARDLVHTNRCGICRVREPGNQQPDLLTACGGKARGLSAATRCTVPQGFLTETRDYEIEVTLDGGVPDDYALALKDIPLSRLSRTGKAIFAFGMDFYAGDLRISLVRGDRVAVSIDLQVDPDIAKVARDEYAAMIADISQATLALYRLSSVTIPAPAKSEGLRSDLVALELTRTNIDAFDRAVSRTRINRSDPCGPQPYRPTSCEHGVLMIEPSETHCAEACLEKRHSPKLSQLPAWFVLSVEAGYPALRRRVARKTAMYTNIAP